MKRRTSLLFSSVALQGHFGFGAAWLLERRGQVDNLTCNRPFKKLKVSMDPIMVGMSVILRRMPLTFRIYLEFTSASLQIV